MPRPGALNLLIGAVAGLAMAALAAPVPVAADTWTAGTTRLSLQYAHLDYAFGAEAERANPGAIVVRVGHRLDDHFGLEGRLGIRGPADTVRGRIAAGDDRGEVDVRLDRLAGLYGTAHHHFVDRFSGYALVGVSNVRGAVANSDDAISNAETGLSGGIGLNYQFGADYRFHIEYMHYIERDDTSLSALGLGFTIPL